LTLKIASVLSNKFVSILTSRKEDSEYQKRSETLGSVTRNTLRIVILVTSAMMIINELGIEIPFPHRTLYMGQDKDGSAPPLCVKKSAEDE
jgi:small-conductance mechanosensitive channel